jgi:hypothetical protein
MKIRYVLLFLAILSAGCGKSDPLKRQAVSGEVTLEGAPLAAGTVTFEPKSGGTMSGSPILAGKFEIPKEQGLSPGEYTVRLSSAGDELAAAEEAPGESNRMAIELIPEEYGTKSSLLVTIKEGEENFVKLDVPERRKRKK